MIATLSSFETQFEPKITEKARSLFDAGNIGPLTKDDLNWHAAVSDNKNYKVTLRVVDNKVTDIFCPCGPKVCAHVVAVMFALQKDLGISAEPFDPAMLVPEPHTLLGRRLNDLIYASRAEGTKDGELEKMGATVTLKEPDVMKMRAMVQKGWFYPHDSSRYPILNGAKSLLGAAILRYAQKDYLFVYAVARAVLTEICSAEIDGTSARECARASVELLRTLCVDREVPIEMRKEVLERVLFATSKKLYQYYHDELLNIMVDDDLDPGLREMAWKDLKQVAESSDNGRPSGKMLDTLHDLLLLLGKDQELEQLKKDNPHNFRDDLIEEAWNSKDYAFVKKLALDGAVTDWRAEHKWKGWLLRVAMEEGDTSYIRMHHKELYLKGGYPQESYDIVKATYTPEEWAVEVETWITAIGRIKYLKDEAVGAMARLCIIEKKADLLLELLQEHCSFSLMQLAEPLLIETHAEPLMKIYREYFTWLAGTSTHRQPAINLRNMLKTVRRTAPGKKMVDELVPHLLGLHPGWKVFREEMASLLR